MNFSLTGSKNDLEPTVRLDLFRMIYIKLSNFRCYLAEDKKSFSIENIDTLTSDVGKEIGIRRRFDQVNCFNVAFHMFKI